MRKALALLLVVPLVGFGLAFVGLAALVERLLADPSATGVRSAVARRLEAALVDGHPDNHHR